MMLDTTSDNQLVSPGGTAIPHAMEVLQFCDWTADRNQ